MKAFLVKYRIWIGGLIALLVIAAAGYQLLIGSRLKVESTRVSRGAVTDWYTESGTIRSGDSVEIVSKVNGDVCEVLVSENSVVQKGDVLLRIDSQAYEYSKEQTEKNIEMLQAELSQSDISRVMTTTPQEYLDGIASEADAANAALQKATTDFTAAQSLYASGDVSTSEYESARAAYDAAKAQASQSAARLNESRKYLAELKKQGMDESSLNDAFYQSETTSLKAQIDSAEIELRRLQDQIDDCTITADRDGIITSLAAKNASMVSAGQTVAELSGSGDRRVEADVLTDVAPYIHAGTKVKTVLKLRGRNETEFGTVDEVNDFATEGSSALGLKEYRVHVRAHLDDVGTADATDTISKDGYGVDVAFLLYENEDALTVPAGAVFESDDAHYVYRIEGGRAVKTKVTVDYTTSTEAVITDGLAEGDAIVTVVDVEDLFDGAKVRI